MDRAGISPIGAKALRSPCERCDRFPGDMPDCIKECDAISRHVRDLNANYVDVRLITRPMEAPMKPAVVREITEASDQIPRCPKHPDQPQKLTHKGRPMGMCLLCMQERQKRNALLRRENTRRKNIAVIDPPETEPLPPVAAAEPTPPAPSQAIPKCPKHPDNDLYVVTRPDGQIIISNHCHQCMLEMSKKGTEAYLEKKRNSRVIPKDEAVLAVDLREHPDIMAMLRESMADGMRTSLEVEVIWHLKQRLKSFQKEEHHA